MLITNLSKQTFSKERVEEEKSGQKEVNSGAVFPGPTLEIILQKKLQDINQKHGGRLCTDKEILFVETQNAKKEFTFRFSRDKDDFMKCKYAVCNKLGLYPKVHCACAQVVYCSEQCRDKDLGHRDSCPEVKKKELDPNLLDFTVADSPRNGTIGLQNLGNTCYMNSALQCLSNTPALVNYFAKHMLFKKEVNPKNALASSCNEVLIQFAKFLNEMWNKQKSGGNYEYFNPIEFKRAVGNNNSMFKGF